MTNFINHTSNCRGIVVDYCVIQPAETQRTYYSFLVSWLPDSALSPSYFNFCHYLATESFRNMGSVFNPLQEFRQVFQSLDFPRRQYLPDLTLMAAPLSLSQLGL